MHMGYRRRLRRLRVPGIYRRKAKRHVLGLQLVMGIASPRADRGLPCQHVRTDGKGASVPDERRPTPPSSGAVHNPIALVGLGAATLHGVEAVAWAALYVWVGAMSDPSTAILYSLSAITSYGHSEVFLQDRWKLLGAIEAMDGLILFGLTTAFLFAAIERVRSSPQASRGA